MPDNDLSQPAQNNAVDHLCRHAGCNKWGSWGYDAGQGVSEWWCLEHRPDHDPVSPPEQQGWISDGNEG
jgi:hypothetical protein